MARKKEKDVICRLYIKVVGRHGQLTAYNTYATLSYTNPLFMSFLGYQNVKKEIIFRISWNTFQCDLLHLRTLVLGCFFAC